MIVRDTARVILYIYLAQAVMGLVGGIVAVALLGNEAPRLLMEVVEKIETR